MRPYASWSRLRTALLFSCLIAAPFAAGCANNAELPGPVDEKPAACPWFDVLFDARDRIPMGAAAELRGASFAGPPTRFPTAADLELNLVAFDAIGEPLTIEAEGGASIADIRGPWDCLDSPDKTELGFHLLTPDAPGHGAIRLLNHGVEIARAKISFADPAALSITLLAPDGYVPAVGGIFELQGGLLDQAQQPIYTQDVTWAVKGPPHEEYPGGSALLIRPIEPGTFVVTGTSHGTTGTFKVDVAPAP
jgi:hypothetical protein